MSSSQKPQPQPQQQQPSIHAFSGTAPELLDAMLLSIANPAKPRANPALSGRELLPYFGSAEPADVVQSPPTRGPRNSSAKQQQAPSPAGSSCSNSTSIVTNTISTNNSAAQSSRQQAAKRKHASPTSGSPTSSSSPPSHSPLKSANHNNRGRGSGSPSAATSSPSSGPRGSGSAAGTPPQQQQQQRSNNKTGSPALTMPSTPLTRTPLQARSASKACTPSNLHNAAAKYYCPGMFSSPKPETLPIPTGLLQRALVAA